MYSFALCLAKTTNTYITAHGEATTLNHLCDSAIALLELNSTYFDLLYRQWDMLQYNKCTTIRTINVVYAISQNSLLIRLL